MIKREIIRYFIIILLANFVISGAFASARDEVYKLEAEGLKKAYQYEKEVREFENEKRTSLYLKEAKKLKKEARDKIDSYKVDVLKLKRKSFKAMNDYISENEVIPGIKSVPINVEVGRKLVFISLSQNERNLEDIVRQAKVYGFTPVMRGFKDGSYKATIKYLGEMIERTGQEILVDPDSFKEFDVRVVPTFVIAESDNLSEFGIEGKKCKENQSCMPAKYNKVAGNVSFAYVMRLFEKSGEKL